MGVNLKEQLRKAQEQQIQSVGDIGQQLLDAQNAKAAAEAKVQELKESSVTRAEYNAALKAANDANDAKDVAEAKVLELKNHAPKKADGTAYTQQEIDHHIAIIAKKTDGKPYTQQEVDDFIKASELVIRDANGNIVDQAAYTQVVASQKTPEENYKLLLVEFMATKQQNGLYPSSAVTTFRNQMCKEKSVLEAPKAAISDTVFDLDMFCDKSAIGQDYDPNNV